MPGGGDTTSTTRTELPDEVKPFLTPWLNTANTLYSGNGPQYFPGSTVAGFSPEQLQAQAGTVARATNGSPVAGAANDYAQSVIGGDFLSAGNPWQSAIDDQIAARVASDASLNGRMGSNYQARALAEGLAAPRYQNYQAERGLQQGMAQFAPQLAQNDFMDLNALNAVGAQRQTQAQNLINADISRFDYEANRPFANTNQMLSLLYGYPGRSQTTTQPGPSTGQQIFGGLAGLGGLALGFL